MKFRSSIIAVLVMAGLFLSAYYPHFNDKEKEAKLFAAVLGILKQMHFSPVEMNDEFSEKVFDSYLKLIDGGKRFLTQEEIDQMAVYQQDLDDHAEDGNFEFFELSLGLIDNAITRSQSIYEEVIQGDFDINKVEAIELDVEKKEYAADENTIRDNWRKSLKYELISKLERKIKAQEEKLNAPDDKDAEELMTDEQKELNVKVVKKSLKELIAESKEEVKELFDDWFKRMSKLRREDRFEAYVNSFASQFDPHTGYFSPKDKQDFDINMGGKLEGIGARLQTDDDYTKVVSIVPGGPAWKGKNLEEDDVILGVTQGHKGEYKDIYGMRIDDVVQLIRGEKGTIVKLNIKKKDGSVEEIVIERDEVIIDVSFAKSLILDQSEVIDNVGYIKLPKFYSSFEGKDGNSCAKDVAEEIKKLKEENVKGIVLDLRYNGGGSLRDVIDMTGLFIEQGPIVQVKSRQRNPYKYEDEDKSVLWDGPLIVMVNSYSASASEILAAALQDYNRALIVGSTTFGKGTVQRFFDLDNARGMDSSMKPYGEIKLTMQKFYRVDGGSTQLKGVVPDIVFPDRFMQVDVGEREYDNAMPWTEIESVTHTQDTYRLPSIDMLRSKSEARIASTPVYDQILANAARVKSNRDETIYPLDLDSFMKMIDDREAEAEQFDDLFDAKVLGLSATNLDIDLADINSDESKKARNDDWLERVHKDVYLKEVLQIMDDMIVMHQQP